MMWAEMYGIYATMNIRIAPWAPAMYPMSIDWQVADALLMTAILSHYVWERHEPRNA